ncbi:DUF2059 domain-containing protein [Spongiimicrobium salis]|uniref:DUF2059 domain-containing protein n=1 Tax=Spongiimicrobium salis TaxID=1667022 RepID=UPI00374CC0C1
MKKQIITFLLFVFTLGISAQENDQFKEDTIKFIKLTGTETAFDGVIAQLETEIPEVNLEAYRKAALKTTDELYDKIAGLYMEEFSHAEIQELISFYNSALGKKMAEKQLMLTQKGMGLGQNWGIEMQQLATKYKSLIVVD